MLLALTDRISYKARQSDGAGLGEAITASGSVVDVSAPIGRIAVAVRKASTQGRQPKRIHRFAMRTNGGSVSPARKPARFGQAIANRQAS